MSTPARVSPLIKLSQAMAKCQPEASAYGKCVVADYNNVFKDKCLQDFLKLQSCVGKQVKVGR